jgi:hypothetical protein
MSAVLDNQPGEAMIGQVMPEPCAKCGSREFSRTVTGWFRCVCGRKRRDALTEARNPDPTNALACDRAAGRPTKLTPEISALIITYIRRGNSLETACARARISKETLRNWIKIAASVRDRAKYGIRFSKIEKTLLQFLADVEQAEARAEVEAVYSVTDAASRGSWQAALAFLERRFPERWAKREEHETNVNVTVGYQSIQVVASTRTDSPPEQRSDNQPGIDTIPESRQLGTGDQSDH